MPEANSDHIVAVLQRQRDQFFNALTVAEINNAALTARVAELEAKLAPANTENIGQEAAAQGLPPLAPPLKAKKT